MNENLAEIQQWYKKDPSLLVAEKAAMEKAFPNFKLKRTEDGRLAWSGTIIPGIWKGIDSSEDDSARQAWEVLAVYENNHPHQQMESSVKVFLINPTIDIVIKHIAWIPRYFLTDNISGRKYFCTADADELKATISPSAAFVLARTVRWLMAFELVITGEITKEEFNDPFI